MTSLGMQTSENCYLSRLARAGPRNCLFLPLEAKSGIYEWPHCHITWNSNINLKFRPFFQKKAFYITHEHKDLYSKAEVFCWPFQINEKKFWFSNSVMHSISATEPWAGAKKRIEKWFITEFTQKATNSIANLISRYKISQRFLIFCRGGDELPGHLEGRFSALHGVHDEPQPRAQRRQPLPVLHLPEAQAWRRQ